MPMVGRPITAVPSALKPTAYCQASDEISSPLSITKPIGIPVERTKKSAFVPPSTDMPWFSRYLAALVMVALLPYSCSSAYTMMGVTPVFGV